MDQWVCITNQVYNLFTIYLRRSILVGVSVPCFVIRRELKVILQHVLHTTSPALCGHSSDDMPVAKIDT